MNDILYIPYNVASALFSILSNPGFILNVCLPGGKFLSLASWSGPAAGESVLPSRAGNAGDHWPLWSGTAACFSAVGCYGHAPWSSRESVLIYILKCFKKAGKRDKHMLSYFWQKSEVLNLRWEALSSMTHLRVSMQYIQPLPGNPQSAIIFIKVCTYPT